MTKFNGGGGGMNYVEQFYSTNIKLRAFEDALAETMVLIQIFVTTLSYFNTVLNYPNPERRG